MKIVVAISAEAADGTDLTRLENRLSDWLEREGIDVQTVDAVGA